MTNSRLFNHTHKSVSKMKKFLFALSAVMFLAVASVQVSAQVYSMKTATGLDTARAINATPKILKLAVSKYYPSQSILVEVTRSGGTLAGKATLEGSKDGTTYYQIKTDSLTVYNVATAQAKFFTLPAANIPYYQVRFVGSGTMEAILRASLILKKP